MVRICTYRTAPFANCTMKLLHTLQGGHHTVMNIAICDDQRECNEYLSSMLKVYFENKLISGYTIMEYTCGSKLINEYTIGMFDVIFLDVNMPGLSGNKTAERIRNLDLGVDIIFVTYMKDQPLIGYNYNAKGFLIKEVSQNQINQLLDRLICEMKRRNDLGVYSAKLKFGEGIVHLKLVDVFYFESHNKDIVAVTDKESFLFREQLANVERDLQNKGFVRINRSRLVNKSHIFKDFGNYLVMSNGQEFSISKSYKDNVRKIFRIDV